jgi:hypothetical protein
MSNFIKIAIIAMFFCTESAKATLEDLNEANRALTSFVGTGDSEQLAVFNSYSAKLPDAQRLQLDATQLNQATTIIENALPDCLRLTDKDLGNFPTETGLLIHIVKFISQHKPQLTKTSTLTDLYEACALTRNTADLGPALGAKMDEIMAHYKSTVDPLAVSKAYARLDNPGLAIYYGLRLCTTLLDNSLLQVCYWLAVTYMLYKA